MSERGRVPPGHRHDDGFAGEAGGAGASGRAGASGGGGASGRAGASGGGGASGRAGGAAERGRERVADAFADVADRIEYRGRRMRRRGGARGQAGRAAESAGRVLGSGADYLRAHDIEEMKLELETRVREKPVPALIAAAVAGFVFARIMR